MILYAWLDCVARKWLNWRVTQALQKDKIHADLFVKNIEAAERGLKLELQCPALMTIFDEAYGLLEESGAINFLEMKGVSKFRMPARIIRVTLQFDDGLSPAEMVMRLKAEKTALQSQLDTLSTPASAQTNEA